MNYAGHHVISATTPVVTGSPLAVGFTWTDTSGTAVLKICTSVSPVTFAAIGGGTVTDANVTFSDITTGNATSSQHGFLPKLSGNADDVFKGDGTYGRTLASGTITTSRPFSFSQTWNAIAVAFKALTIDITSTASDGSSKPFQINVGGGEVLSVARDGRLVGGQGAFFNSDVRGGTFSMGNGGYFTVSNGVDFNAGFQRESAGMKTTLGASGYGRHSAESFQWVPNGASKPAAAAGVRGLVWYTPGAAGVADTIEVCAKSSLDAYAWYPMATIP